MVVKDAVNNATVASLSISGPASYAAGGFLVDATSTHSYLGFIIPTITSIGVLPACEYEVLLNKDLSGNEALGKAVIKLMRRQFNQAASGAVTNAPSGVTTQSSLSANATSTHTHDFTHSHGTVTSAAMTSGGNGSPSGGSIDSLGHTHNFTIGTATITTTPAGGSHSHNRAFEYDHRHDLTTAVTDIALTEVAAATDLSSVTFIIICLGFGAT